MRPPLLNYNERQIKKGEGSNFKTEFNDLLMDLYYSNATQSVSFRILLASAIAFMFKTIGFYRKYSFFLWLVGSMEAEV